MNELFVPYELALELKELGFDELCLAFYDGKQNNQVYYNNLRNGSGDYEPFKNTERLTWFGAPLYSQVFKWLYQKLDIENGTMPLDTESQQLLLKELIDKVSSKHLLV